MSYTDKIDSTNENYTIRTYENGFQERFLSSSATIEVEPEETLADKIVDLQSNQLIIMGAIADLYSALPPTV